MLSGHPEAHRGTGRKVLFIAGYGRSGSTLLDRVLGQVPGFVSVGELRHVFTEGYLENRRCGCGEPFRECGFWQAVTERAFSSLSASDLRSLLELKRRIDRWWLLPQLGWRLGTPRQRRDVECYRGVLAALYEAIAEQSAAEVLIDSSKDVSHGYALRGVGVDAGVGVGVRVEPTSCTSSATPARSPSPGSGGCTIPATATR